MYHSGKLPLDMPSLPEFYIRSILKGKVQVYEQPSLAKSPTSSHSCELQAPSTPDQQTTSPTTTASTPPNAPTSTITLTPAQQATHRARTSNCCRTVDADICPAHCVCSKQEKRMSSLEETFELGQTRIWPTSTSDIQLVHGILRLSPVSDDTTTRVVSGVGNRFSGTLPTGKQQCVVFDHTCTDAVISKQWPRVRFVTVIGS